MKRDMDLIRELLLGIESDAIFDGDHWVRPDDEHSLGVIGKSKYSNTEIAYHLRMLIEQGFIKGDGTMEEMPIICQLTWYGHELLDDIRDAGIWVKTKARLDGLPSAAISILTEVATSEIKKHLGLSS